MSYSHSNTEIMIGRLTAAFICIVASIMTALQIPISDKGNPVPPWLAVVFFLTGLYFIRKGLRQDDNDEEE